MGKETLAVVDSKKLSTKKITYRTMQMEDMPGILRLWEEHSGWGAITEEKFRSWYLETPLGPCITVVAVDQNQNIVGQVILAPSILSLDGEPVRVLKALAPILDGVIRKDSLTQTSHPIFEMARVANQAARIQGYHFVYSFPAYGWVSLFKTFPKFGLPECLNTLYSCMAIPVEPFSGLPDYQVELLDSFGEELDSFFVQASSNLPFRCLLNRDARWLNWKWGEDIKWGVRDLEGNVLGFLVIDPKSHLVKDALALSEKHFALLFKLIINQLSSQKESWKISQIKVMYTPFMENVLSEFELEKVPFQFAFNVYSVSEKYEFSALKLDNWYMMPTD